MDAFGMMGFIFGMSGFTFGIIAFTTVLGTNNNVKVLEKRIEELEEKS